MTPRQSPLAELPTGIALWSGWYSYELPLYGGVVTARPQRLAFQGRQLVIPREPENWIIHDICVGGVPTLPCPLPGPVFMQLNSQLSLPVCQAEMDLAITVEYIGPNPDGAMFFAAMIGTGIAADYPAGRREVLPLSMGPVRSSPPYGKRVVIELEGTRYRVEESLSRITAVRRDPSDLAPPDHARPGQEHVFETPRAVSLHLVLEDEARAACWQGVDETDGKIVFQVWDDGRMSCDPDGLDL